MTVASDGATEHRKWAVWCQVGCCLYQVDVSGSLPCMLGVQRDGSPITEFMFGGGMMKAYIRIINCLFQPMFLPQHHCCHTCRLQR